MEEPGDVTPFLPPRRSLKALREAAADCHGCHLLQPATQTVFGEGPRKARVVLVGEKPDDREDREGRPFVGHAGREVDNALQDAGIDRASAYVTNVVKHFEFEEHGKRRIHQRPDAGAIKACRPWFDAEFDVVAPKAIVILGATAGKALLGNVPAPRVARPATRDRPRTARAGSDPAVGDPARARRRRTQQHARRSSPTCALRRRCWHAATRPE